MADVVDPAVRSRIMASIRGKDTRPEMIVRRGLHAMGFRFRLHHRKLPGRPDLVFARYRAVILVHGCFWHGHECHLFRWPASRVEFWTAKINGNKVRDTSNIARLRAVGWRVLVIWECALKGRSRRPVNAVLEEAGHWLRSGTGDQELAGDTGDAD